MFLLIPLDIGEAELQHGDIDQCRLLMERKMGKKKKIQEMYKLQILNVFPCTCVFVPVLL